MPIHPAAGLYFVIQLMYIDRENLTSYQDRYWKLVRELIDAAPSLLGIIDEISEQIVNSQYYQALKLAKQLIFHEEEVLFNVQKPIACLRGR